jgi:hypothetical protein
MTTNKQHDLTAIVTSASIKRHDLGDVAGAYALGILQNFEPSGNLDADVDWFIALLEKAKASADFEEHLAASADPNDPLATKAKEYVNLGLNLTGDELISFVNQQ